MSLSNEENISLKKGQIEEQKFKDQIPQEFFTQCQAAENEELKYLKSCGAHVAALYDILRKADIPMESARTIVVGRFIKYRSERRIVDYLPNEVKDKSKQKSAEQSNIKQRAKREKLMREDIQRAVLHAGGTEAEAEHISNDPAVIREGLDTYTRLGPKDGETPEERRREAAKLAVAKEIGEEIPPNAEIKDIIVELQNPNAGTVASINSIRIRDLWNKSKSAYLVVDTSRGDIVNVFLSREAALQAQAQAKAQAASSGVH